MRFPHPQDLRVAQVCVVYLASAGFSSATPNWRTNDASAPHKAFICLDLSPMDVSLLMDQGGGWGRGGGAEEGVDGESWGRGERSLRGEF